MTKVVAIMVTGKTTERYPLALRAIRSFQQQSHDERKLLIVNDNAKPLLGKKGVSGKHIVEHRVKSDEPLSLGALRNIGIQQAIERFQPDYLMQWDDDDYSHPNRMLYQLQRTPEGFATIFQYEIHCHLQNRNAFVNNGKQSRVKGFAGTMLWPAACPVRFPEIGKHEDTEFLLEMQKRFCKLHVLQNDPAMYVRFYHGHNTWDEKHVMKRKTGARSLATDEAVYLNGLLATLYAADTISDRGADPVDETEEEEDE